MPTLSFSCTYKSFMVRNPPFPKHKTNQYTIDINLTPTCSLWIKYTYFLRPSDTEELDILRSVKTSSIFLLKMRQWRLMIWMSMMCLSYRHRSQKLGEKSTWSTMQTCYKCNKANIIALSTMSNGRSKVRIAGGWKPLSFENLARLIWEEYSKALDTFTCLW
jgi:hypothetical protein